jgi:putative ABC transport system permease protein
MIRHYFKIALRNLGRQKILSFINISGLSIGLACFSLFLLYAVNEFNFDRFHKKADNIYRVYRWTDAMSGREAQGDPYSPSPLGPAMKADLSDIENYARIRSGWGESFIKADNKVMRINVSYTDPQFFSLFTFPFVYGNAQTALKDLHSIVLTRTKAKELFGVDNVIGRTVDIKIDDSFTPFTVSAVVEDVPANSSIQFDLLGSYQFMETTEFRKTWR